MGGDLTKIWGGRFISSKYIVPKMSSLCYVIRFMYHFSNINTLKVIYFAYLHSRMKFGIIFWDNSTIEKESFSYKSNLWELWQGLNAQFCVNLYSEHWKYSLYLLKEDYLWWLFSIHNHHHHHHHHLHHHHWLYNRGWALASSSKCHQQFLSWASASQFLQPSFLESFSTPFWIKFI